MTATLTLSPHQSREVAGVLQRCYLTGRVAFCELRRGTYPAPVEDLTLVVGTVSHKAARKIQAIIAGDETAPAP